MLDNLSDRFESAMRSLSGRGKISEGNVREAMEEVREEIRDVVRAPLPPAPPQPPAVRRTNVSFSASSRVLQMRAPLDGAFMRIKAAYTADRDDDCEDTDTVEA